MQAESEPSRFVRASLRLAPSRRRNRRGHEDDRAAGEWPYRMPGPANFCDADPTPQRGSNPLNLLGDRPHDAASGVAVENALAPRCSCTSSTGTGWSVPGRTWRARASRTSTPSRTWSPATCRILSRCGRRRSTLSALHTPYQLWLARGQQRDCEESATGVIWAPAKGTGRSTVDVRV